MKRKVVSCEHCEKQGYEARIAELERRVRELEARPIGGVVHHHHYLPPIIQQPYVPPTWEPYRITCGDPPPVTTSTATWSATMGLSPIN